MSTIELRALAEQAREEICAFAQRLIQTPSFPGQEQEAAELVRQELLSLGIEDVSADRVGNVLARLPGAQRNTVLLHAHLDIVDPGDVSAWRYGPFAGQITDGYIWGRGASDDKASVAAQVYALGLLKRAGASLPSDVCLAAVVGEEAGGQGTRELVRHLKPAVAVIGEPSGNALRQGHRGRFEFIIAMHGRSAHASAPARGLSPHYSMARFLLALDQAPKAKDDTFGGTSVAPTLLYVDQTSSNVIPACVTVHLDWRNSPIETEQEARDLIQRVLQAALDPGVRADVSIRERHVRSYTGIEDSLLHNCSGFFLAQDDPLLMRAHRALVDAFGHPVPIGIWTFTTDGGWLAPEGVPCIGFGPGEEHMAHVLDERVSIDQLVEATAGYMALALSLG
jgi:succinyl-diaminopimelate desuccinylase